jgi:hypothetical protein
MIVLIVYHFLFLSSPFYALLGDKPHHKRLKKPFAMANFPLTRLPEWEVIFNRDAYSGCFGSLPATICGDL